MSLALIIITDILSQEEYSAYVADVDPFVLKRPAHPC